MTGAPGAVATLDTIASFPSGEAVRRGYVDDVGAYCDAWWEVHRERAIGDAQEALRTYESEGPVFDLLGGLGLREDERFLTRVLAWLLNPNGSHGLRASFLRTFIAACGLDGASVPEDGSGWSVERERRFAWSGSKKADSPDLLILSPGTIFVVEHKVNAGQTSADQYDRYRALATKRWPDLVAYTVFLRSNPLWNDDPKPGGAFDAVLGLNDLCTALETAKKSAPRRASLLVASVLRGLRRSDGEADRSADLLRDGLHRALPTPVLLLRTQALIAYLDQA